MQRTDFVAAEPIVSAEDLAAHGLGALPAQRARIRYGYWIGAAMAGAALWAVIFWLVLG